MISELSFLIELLLKHKLPVATRDLIAARIKDVEQGLSAVRHISSPVVKPLPIGMVQQAASTQAILDRNPDLAIPVVSNVVPVEQVAQTPAAAAAMAARAAMINQAMSGKPKEGEKSPRKFHATP